MITVVGIGCDGVEGLGAAARDAIACADILVGGARHLAMVPASVSASRHTWPRPLAPGVKPLFDSFPAAASVVVLASGDPMFHGVGTTLARLLPDVAMRVIPHVSSAALACARLGWTVEDTPVVSLTTSHPDELVPLAQAGRPFLVLGAPDVVAEVLARRGYSPSALTALAELGGPNEAIAEGTAAAPPQESSSLVVTAVVPVGPVESLLPGLADDSFDNDGQLTKTGVRIHAVTALRPRPGQLLWDIGGGAGSIAIEFCRSTPSTRARCFERNNERADRIAANAEALGVSRQVAVSLGDAGESIAGLDESPDAVFIGGGLSDAAMVDAAYAALAPGGRIVAHAVTLESVARLLELAGQYGGELTSVSIGTHHPVGRFTTLKPALPVVQWIAEKGKVS